jgi:prephenate dehydrogenase
LTWKPARIGLIGGGGKLGTLFGGLFEAAGYAVRSAGEQPDPAYGGLVADCDVVIVTVPIAQTVPVIRRIAPHLRAGQLLCDFTSIKQPAVAAMLETPAWVIGAHPLFAPMPNPAGQNVVLCPERPGPCLDWLRGFLEGRGMRTVVMTPRAHDEAMAFIQGLTHFLNITFARTLQTRKADIEALLQVCSPVYRVLFAMLSRILSGDPHLYGQIQLLNRENIPVLYDFVDNARDLLAAVEGQQWGSFDRIFGAAAAYLGDFKATAREESDFLIEQMRLHLEGHDPA